MTTTLNLGAVTFKDFEIPESITFGGTQKLAIKNLVGGGKVVDAMGVNQEPAAWNGIFLGPDAINRAMLVKSMYEGGQLFRLTFDQLAFDVVIETYKAEFRRPYYVPYQISCQVVKDRTQFTPVALPNVTTAIRSDNALSGALATKIGVPSLTTSISSLSSAITKISDFAKATQSTIRSVLAPLAQAQAQVKALITTAENTLQTVTTVGGLLPNNPAAKLATQLISYANANTQQPALVQLQGVLGRIGVNIGQINSSVRIITVPGGNLMDIAAKQYGDAMGYTALLAANPALKGDPQLTGITTLTVPKYANQTDGAPS